MARTNLAGRAGRWSAAHPWRALGIWLLFVAVAYVVGHMYDTQKLAEEQIGTGESARAQSVIDEHFTRHASETVMLESDEYRASEPQFRTAVADVVAGLERTGQVLNIRSPLAPGQQRLVSPNGHAVLVQFSVRGESTSAVDRIQPVLDAVAKAARAHPDITIMQSGDASINKGITDTILKDFTRAEKLSFPIALLVLLVAFGTVVAAVVPVALATTAIIAASGLLILVSRLTPIADQASSVMLLIGLAVGVDYSMFYLKRAREERAAGRDADASLRAAAATSGRAVMVSGLTVLMAMSGMYLAESRIFIGFAEGTMLVVATAVIGSLTALPATLSLLGDRVEVGRIPFLTRARRAEQESRVWGFVLDRVLRRPLVAAVAAVAVLLTLASPALSMRTETPGVNDLPHDLAVLKAYDRIQQVFPGGPSPAIVVVSAPDVTSPPVRQGIARLQAAAIATGRMYQPTYVEVADSKRAALVYLPLAGTGQDAPSVAALRTLRGKVVPSTIGRVPGVTVAVAGVTAGTTDFNASMHVRFPIVVAFVLVLAFLLLLLAFRSVVVALTAIVLNLLSVAAAYGVLTLVFQKGLGEWLLDYKSSNAIASWLPLFLFVVLFGLSMDYHVFILSRIREGHDRGLTTSAAVSQGIKSTAGVVTAAAVVMVFVFGTFATLSMVSLKETGIGLATAVLLDATVVRGVLLPSVMKMLGPRNWYLPHWLEWLPQVTVTEVAAPAPAPRTPVASGRQ